MSFGLIPVNLLFMILGVLLYQFVELKGIIVPPGTDNLFPYLRNGHRMERPPNCSIGKYVLGLK